MRIACLPAGREYAFLGAWPPTAKRIDEFSKHAIELLANIPVLTKARDSYQRAKMVSAEVRSILDAGDANLQNLMAHLEEAVAVQLGKPSSDKKKPESVRAESTQATSEPPDYSRILP
jgi:hypothetical protein